MIQLVTAVITLEAWLVNNAMHIFKVVEIQCEGLIRDFPCTLGY